MPTLKSPTLTAAYVKTTTRPGRHFDAGYRHGLFLNVEKSGSKQWIQRILINGKRREIGLGSYPSRSLAEAREMAAANWRSARDGNDPLKAKREAKVASLSFEAAVVRYHELHKGGWTNAKHANDFINSLKTYAFPRLGSLKIADITSGDVMNVLEPIWLTKQETARRVLQRINGVFGWAVAQNHRADNPAAFLKRSLPRQAQSKAHRLALPYPQVAQCIDAVKVSGAYRATKLAIEFLILTAARSGNVRNAKWEQIHLEGDGAPIWLIPAEETKRKDEDWRIPLSPRALEILREAKSLPGNSGLLFPSMSDRPLSDMTLSKLIKELGFKADIHGFRTSFRTWAQEQTDAGWDVAEAALHHVVGSRSGKVYARSDVLDKRRGLMDQWASYIAVMSGSVASFRSAS
ncbi:MAG: hypothetical protein RL764_978 [Pseudomonadota bacterium]|jgi:integrase